MKITNQQSLFRAVIPHLWGTTLVVVGIASFGCDRLGGSASPSEVTATASDEPGVVHDFGTVPTSSRTQTTLRLSRPGDDVEALRIGTSCSCIGAKIVAEDSSTITLEIGFRAVRSGPNSAIAFVTWHDESKSLVRLKAFGHDLVTVLPGKVSCSNECLASFEVLVILSGDELPECPFDRLLIADKLVMASQFTLSWERIELGMRPDQTQVRDSGAQPQSNDAAVWRLSATARSPIRLDEAGGVLNLRLLASDRLVCMLEPPVMEKR